MKNYYGSLCTEMYEILHEKAPSDELDFYLSYAKKEDKILEPLCGSGRFLVPFMEKGYDISGLDLSKEMLEKLKQKEATAKAFEMDIMEYAPQEKFDYIFISSGSVSLFTDMQNCKEIMAKMYALLEADGVFVFAVDTIANRLKDRDYYKESIKVKTDIGDEIVLKSKNFYDEKTQTQFSTSLYELYHENELQASEFMDFQTHLYYLGEMEQILKEVGFTQVCVYDSFAKTKATNNEAESFFYECRK